MVKPESSGSTGTAKEKAGSHETNGSRTGWETIIENLVVKIETVSSHFSYTEEYVMDHSPEWLTRKYWQAMKETWEQSQMRVLEGFKSLSMLIDAVFNKGANYSAFIQDSFEDALKTTDEQDQVQEKFVQGQWWQSKGKTEKSS